MSFLYRVSSTNQIVKNRYGTGATHLLLRDESSGLVSSRDLSTLAVIPNGSGSVMNPWATGFTAANNNKIMKQTLGGAPGVHAWSVYTNRLGTADHGLLKHGEYIQLWCYANNDAFSEVRSILTIYQDSLSFPEAISYVKVYGYFYASVTDDPGVSSGWATINFNSWGIGDIIHLHPTPSNPTIVDYTAGHDFATNLHGDCVITVTARMEANCTINVYADLDRVEFWISGIPSDRLVYTCQFAGLALYPGAGTTEPRQVF